MPQEDHRACELNHPEEILWVVFPANDDATIIMKPSKQTLDFPATTIASQRAAVLCDWFAPVPAVRRDQFHTEMLAYPLIQWIAVVRFVGDAVSWSMLGQQSRGLLDVVLLARGDDQFDGTAFRIDREVQLGTESPARASQRFLLRTPFFAPAACW